MSDPNQRKERFVKQCGRAFWCHCERFDVGFFLRLVPGVPGSAAGRAPEA
jgi:hypothetical protein